MLKKNYLKNVDFLFGRGFYLYVFVSKFVCVWMFVYLCGCVFIRIRCFKFISHKTLAIRKLSKVKKKPQKQRNHTDWTIVSLPSSTHSSLPTLSSFASPHPIKKECRNICIYVKMHSIICTDLHINVCVSNSIYTNTLTFKRTQT